MPISFYPIKIKNIFSIILVMELIVVFAGPAIASQEEKPELPALIESIRFEKKISFCGVEVPLEEGDVKKRLEKEMLLALWDRPQVILWIKRAGRYFYHIETILDEEQMPQDLKYVPVVESALRPHAGSAKGAVGYWQFIKSTGRHHGLIINSRIDERRNIFKSTRAACRYLKRMHEKFGSHLLALAAFNMGEFALKAEIKAQNNTDYFSLYLPIETQRYIFKLISAKLILENPENYGFILNKDDLYPRLAFDRVNLKTQFQIPILLVAKAAGVTFKTIKDLNPELRGYYIGKGTTRILVPLGSAQGFENNFSTYYNEWEAADRHHIHVVEKGENLSMIAQKYGMTLSSLLKLNQLSMGRVIHPGDRLFVK